MGNFILRGNDAFDCDTSSGTATTANAARAITGFSGSAKTAETMMRISQRTSQCQRSHCCLLAVREPLPLLILELVEAPVETAPTATPGVPTPVEAPVQVVPAAPSLLTCIF